MSKKNLLFYFQEQEFAEKTAFEKESLKKNTYKHFYQALEERGFNIYYGSQLGGYIDSQNFHNLLAYENEKFVKIDSVVTMDIIFDRSSIKNIIPDELKGCVFNIPSFKAFCSDKNATYTLLHKYMPKSFEIHNQGQFQDALKQMEHLKSIVLKPSLGMKGHGIVIDSPENISRQNPDFSTPYILQQFVDTSHGIPGISTTIHDVRIVIVNNKIILASLRTPAEGSLLANVAQGGSIREISISLIPENILKTIREVQEIIQSNFGQPSYSIDFGVDENGVPYIFELNDRIGFPQDIMPNSKMFAEELALAIETFSNQRAK